MTGVGWTTRAASSFTTSLPVAVLVWLAFVLCGRIGRPADIPVSPRLIAWGAGLGMLFFAAFLVFECVLLRRDFPEPENWIVLFPSLLRISRLAWGGVVLWLLWIALWTRPRAKIPLSTSKRRIEDWEMPLLETLPFRAMDWGWNTLKWGTKTLLPPVFGMLCVGGACLTLLGWPDDRGMEPLWDAQHPFFLAVSLAVLPTFWVWAREGWHWSGTRQRLRAPQIFVARARLLLGGYVLVALLLLPVSIWVQSRLSGISTVGSRRLNRGGWWRRFRRCGGFRCSD